MEGRCRAVYYCRVSTDDENQATSIRNQKEEALKIMKDNNWQFVDGYVEGIVDNYTVTAYIYTRRDGVLDINVRASKYLISNADIAQKVIDKYRNYVR